MTPTPIKAGSHHTTNDKAFELITARLESGSRILDLGAGRGHLARRIGSWLEARGGGASRNRHFARRIRGYRSAVPQAQFQRAVTV